MKKIICSLVSFILIINLFSISILGDENLLEKATNQMLTMGFTQEEINDLPEEEILKYSEITSFTHNDEYIEFEYLIEVNAETKNETIISTVKKEINEATAIEKSIVANKTYEEKIKKEQKILEKIRKLCIII